jgi:two-component system chemotaxis sensor kinase CheA
LERIARDADLPELGDTLDALERVSADLQQEVMQTRMVPVGNIFNRFPRMVRDLARDLGKDVTLETDGLDIELDRTVLDEIGDPIVHLLRNCVDHGIESPEERVAASKPARGTIFLAAEREREQIRITVSDDGRGMDVGRIWAAAVDRGLADPSSRDAYSDHDVLMFVCAPGFSTVDQATKVSGRGVGMDVVKGKIEYLGGTISF